MRRHLDGVLRTDPVAMAADYSLAAVLVRPDGERHGWRAIADYFDTVPDRMGGGELSFGPIVRDGDDSTVVRWNMTRVGTPPVSGTDTYTVAGGRIVHQTVQLDRTDF